MNRGRTCGRGPRPAGCTRVAGVGAARWSLRWFSRSAPVPYCAVPLVSIINARVDAGVRGRRSTVHCDFVRAFD
jgi:hypothetical protein